MVAGLVNLAVLAWAGEAAAARIVVLGDSLTAGYGLAREEAFPARLEAALKAEGVDAEVINAGVSGDTTAGGLRRLDWALASGSGPADMLIVELGANDGLRGIDPAETEANLDAILTRARQKGLKILLTGMVAPPNLGREYAAEFAAVFPRLAAKHDVALYPFFLEGVAANPALNLADRIHPTAAGVDVIVNGILPSVKGVLSRP